MSKIYQYRGKIYCKVDLSGERDDYAGDLLSLFLKLQEDNLKNYGFKTIEEYIEKMNSELVIGDTEDEEGESGWIPTSRRNPKGNGWYFVTCESIHNRKRFVDKIFYSVDEGWHIIMSFPVIAWMPRDLLEPWDGEVKR